MGYFPFAYSLSKYRQTFFPSGKVEAWEIGTQNTYELKNAYFDDNGDNRAVISGYSFRDYFLTGNPTIIGERSSTENQPGEKITWIPA